MIFWAARLLEMAGIRRWYAGMARTSQEPMLPPILRAHEVDGSTQRLVKLRQNSRYYLLSNLLRIVVLMPMLVGLVWAPLPWLMVYFAVLVGVHLLSASLDAYKCLLLRRVLALRGDEQGYEDAADEPKEHPPITPLAGHWWFDLRRFETERFFHLIGVAGVRRWVLEYVSRTQLSKAEREMGERPFFLADPNRANAIRFEHTTRVNEGVHLALGATNVIPLLSFLGAQVHWAAAWAAVVLVFDLYLSLLQRYLRWRVQGLVRRVNMRSEGHRR